ncbi:uncharacterized protein K441DRAFT_114344 [Cenococcum geophilum 1.58]|uniref:uncharacterized protein n=1 Tax=Cenococcum geophilum 1.58 TaxID=794803 RepID=UPI00358EF6FD|nr:hypothetical protein K441DRAFT_114344 [Cenococcum geophilum 1.58]
MKLGDAWLGVPFLLCGILFALIMIITFTVSLRDLSILQTEDDEVIASADVTQPMLLVTEEPLVPGHFPLRSWKASGFPTRTSRAFLMNAVRRDNIATASSALLSLETSGKISNTSCATTQPEVTP